MLNFNVTINFQHGCPIKSQKKLAGEKGTDLFVLFIFHHSSPA